MNSESNNLRPMRFGRAMHMDLSRASDEDLARAYKVLDDYDNSGKASAYTQDLIDDRLSDIDDEGDRRAGVEPVQVERKPREFWHPGADVSVDDLPEESISNRIYAALDDVAFDPGQVPAILDRFEREGVDPAIVADFRPEAALAAAL